MIPDPSQLGLPEMVRFGRAVFDEVDDATEVQMVEGGSLPPGAREPRRQSFRAGRHAAHRALDALGITPTPVMRGEDGQPEWPPGVVGSITHSSHHAIAAVATTELVVAIGIDLEQIGDFDELSEHVAFDEEITYLDSLNGHERVRASFEIFSAKESIYKAYAPRAGSFFGYQAARVTPAGNGHLVARMVEEVSGAPPIGETFTVHCASTKDWVLTAVVEVKPESGS